MLQTRISAYLYIKIIIDFIGICKIKDKNALK